MRGRLTRARTTRVDGESWLFSELISTNQPVHTSGKRSREGDIGMIVALADDAILCRASSFDSPTMAKSDRHHPLLIYDRLFGQWRVPALLITIVFVLLAWLAPG